MPHIDWWIAFVPTYMGMVIIIYGVICVLRGKG
jgi:hypothetical protein